MSAPCPAERNLRSYIRRPDAAFWLDLFRPAPMATENDHARRIRITRYTLGGALLGTTPYVVLSLLIAPQDMFWVAVLNIIGLASYGLGMWAASLGAHAAARMWLMATLLSQVSLLTWLTGNVLGVSVFSFVIAALGRVLFSAEEHAYRWVFIGVPMLVLIAGATIADTSYVDFSAVPLWMQVFARIGNAVFACGCVIVILGVFDHEVLRSEASLVDARDRSDRLLHAVLPRKIAEELRLSDRMIADRHPEVTVLFADLAGFTPWASQHNPEEVLVMLEKVFSRFDGLVAKAGAEKIKTIGDAYMVVSGAPDPREDHVHVMARLALAFVAEVKKLREETGIPLDLRVGLHTGPVIAGVIGAMRFTYDIWGDTVNTASRMESHGEPGRIQISAETRARIEKDFCMEPRGMIEVKGKGSMETWWLLSEQAA